VRRWRAAQSWPRTETIVALSETLEVSIDYLVLGRERRERPPRPEDAAEDLWAAQLREAIQKIPRRHRETLCALLLGHRCQPVREKVEE
jgi:hypothetical protein